MEVFLRQQAISRCKDARAVYKPWRRASFCGRRDLLSGRDWSLLLPMEGCDDRLEE